MNKYTVFASSPSDVPKERKLLSDVIDEINDIHGKQPGYEPDLWKYEERAYPISRYLSGLCGSIFTERKITGVGNLNLYG